MKIYRSTDELPEFRKAVLTIGTFDGVHEGHKAILNSVVQYAKTCGGTSILITFEPHPRKLIFPNEPLRLLQTLEEKLEVVARSGVDAVVVIPFTKAFSQLSAQAYITDFLVAHFHPEAIIIGYDHRFGNDRSGDIGMLRLFAAQCGFEVIEIPVQLIDAAAVSSTQIRKALSQGRMADAAAMTGQYYSISGTVVKGAQLGRTIGYPTANIRISSADKLIPHIGVYTVWVKHKDQYYGGMMSIGYNPTVTDDTSIKLEVNIFGLEEDLYGQELEVSFIQRLRNEVKFPGLPELIEQLHEDKVQSLAILAVSKKPAE